MNSWCVTFPHPDKTYLAMTQQLRHQMQGKRPFQTHVYFKAPSIFWAVLLFVMQIAVLFFAYFKPILNFLLNVSPAFLETINIILRILQPQCNTTCEFAFPFFLYCSAPQTLLSRPNNSRRTHKRRIGRGVLMDFGRERMGYVRYQE
jgi:hypothetical protein